jgi:hypothetical protein
MARYSRIFIALAILLSGLALIPQAGFFAGVVRWQRFAGGYEDVVTVTRARYRSDDNELEVRAISSAGGLATLSVYRTSDNAFIGTLQFEGSDHRGEFIISPNPQVITVRSSLGGESTVLVLDGSGVPPTVTPSVTVTPGGPTNTPTSVPPTNTPTTVPPTVTPGGPTVTPTSVPPTVTPGGPTLTPTSVPPTVTPEGPTNTPTSVPPTVTPGGPTLTPTTEPDAPTATPTATTEPGGSSSLYLPLLYRAGQ